VSALNSHALSVSPHTSINFHFHIPPSSLASQHPVIIIKQNGRGLFHWLGRFDLIISVGPIWPDHVCPTWIVASRSKNGGEWNHCLLVGKPLLRTSLLHYEQIENHYLATDWFGQLVIVCKINVCYALLMAKNKRTFLVLFSMDSLSFEGHISTSTNVGRLLLLKRF